MGGRTSPEVGQDHERQDTAKEVGRQGVKLLRDPGQRNNTLDTPLHPVLLV
jgi:hypothetical protein